MKLRLNIDWKKVLVFLFVSAALLYLTGSLATSAGIILLLFVADSLLGDWEYRRHTRKLFDDLRRDHDSNSESADTRHGHSGNGAKTGHEQ